MLYLSVNSDFIYETKKGLYLIFIIALLFGCTSDKQTTESIPIIVIRKNYSEQEIVLTDIAEFTDLHLNTQNDDFLYRGGINYKTENTLIVTDQASYSFLFFSKDGEPISGFNRYGQGPEEYFSPHFTNVCYDEATDDF